MSDQDESATASGAEVVVPDGVDSGAEQPGADLLGAGGLGFDLGSMMEMAQNMQEQMAEAQQQLAVTEVLGSAGGGLVTVTLNGHLHLKGLHVDPTAVDVDDPSMLEDLVLAAWQDAHDQVARLQAAADPLGAMGGMGGDLTGGLGGLFGGS